MFHSRDGRNPVVVFGLLPHEQKMSVLNVVLKRPPTVDFDEPIKSKTNLIFQCGFRRFIAQPIFSQHTNGNKFKVQPTSRSSSNIYTQLFLTFYYITVRTIFSSRFNSCCYNVCTYNLFALLSNSNEVLQRWFICEYLKNITILP